MKFVVSKARELAFLSLMVSVCASSVVYGWGERGHHVVGSMAGRLLGKESASKADQKAMGRFFSERTIMLGHLSNIPDISWRDSTRKRISKMNSPNHYFGPERVLGVPGDNEEAFLRKVREFPASYPEVLEKFEGKESKLPGVPEKEKTVDVYRDLGVTPWRVQELYDLMVTAFRCAKGKETRPPTRGLPRGVFPRIPLPFFVPEDGGLGENAEVPLPTYQCKSETPREADLGAALFLGGVMGHFVGDQAQPYHPTADYDGWVTGNGGIHLYFETLVVHELDQRLNADVLAKASDPQFQQMLERKFFTDLSRPNGVARFLISMGADSLSHKDEVRQADDQFAMVKRKDSKGNWIPQKSQVLEWGDHPRYHAPGSIKMAERKDPSDSSVKKGFRSIIVDRLATGTVALAHLWKTAWEQAGKPKLDDQNAISLPYPLDVPFIWPSFDPDALKESLEQVQAQKKSLKESTKKRNSSAFSEIPRDPRYPAHWWKPADRSTAPEWEILPQDAGPGEVILSKRNELGLLSNFAATPIVFRGVRYASIEGFWQMMKYPENEEDPRAQFPGIEWPYTRDEVAQMTAFEAKEAGDLASQNMKKMGIHWITFEGKRIDYKGRDQDEHYDLIYGISLQKVLQNAPVKKVLLQTGDLILRPDHHQSSSATAAYHYFEIYMDIREKLQCTLGMRSECPEDQKLLSLALSH